MNLLAIDSAFEPCSAALWMDGEVLERFDPGPRHHAERLLPFVQDLLAESGLALRSLDAIGFSRGPGSFTSLRIGIGVVQGLAWGADLPVVPVSSLRTVAQVVAGQGVARACVAMDARMDEVFCGRYEAVDGLMRAVGNERVCDPARALPDDAAAWMGVGNGFERYAVLSAAPVAGRITDALPRAAALARLAAFELAEGGEVSAELAQPVYLRNHVADKPKDRRA